MDRFPFHPIHLHFLHYSCSLCVYVECINFDWLRYRWWAHCVSPCDIKSHQTNWTFIFNSMEFNYDQLVWWSQTPEFPLLSMILRNHFFHIQIVIFLFLSISIDNEILIAVYFLCDKFQLQICTKAINRSSNQTLKLDHLDFVFLSLLFNTLFSCVVFLFQNPHFDYSIAVSKVWPQFAIKCVFLFKYLSTIFFQFFM